MKEITRIHIAKVAYDIEVPAKKELEKYIHALERYAEDKETLDDIEIRITELLAENGVQAGGVIAVDNIAAVRQQLGEPSDFAPEGSIDAAGENEYEAGDTPRKLYRDKDAAILGGVLSGLARFFRIDPVFVRLIFVVLLIGSFGTASIIYLIMWLIVPPARTATEKLQMRGRSVTLDTIKRIGEQEDVERNQAAGMVRRTLRYCAGSLLIIGSLSILAVTAVIGGGMLFGFGTSENSPFYDILIEPTWHMIVATALYIASGLLLATLGFLLAYALFTARFTKRIALTVVSVIVAGIVAFGVGVGVTVAGVSYGTEQAQEAMTTTKQALPDEFKDVKKLSVSAYSVGLPYGRADLSISYVVDSTAMEYEITALPGLKPAIVVDGESARITLKSNVLHDKFSASVRPQLVIRGPAMDEVVVEQGGLQYTSLYPTGQQAIRFQTLPTTNLTTYGRFTSATLVSAGTIDVSESTITNLAVELNDGTVEGGVVRSLSVTQPDVCPASYQGYGENELRVRAVSGGSIAYNGVQRDADSIKTDCGRVIIGDEDEDWEDQ